MEDSSDVLTISCVAEEICYNILGSCNFLRADGLMTRYISRGDKDIYSQSQVYICQDGMESPIHPEIIAAYVHKCFLC